MNLYKLKFISLFAGLILFACGARGQAIGSKNSTITALGKFHPDSALLNTIRDTATANKITGNQIYFNGIVYWWNGTKWVTGGSGKTIYTGDDVITGDRIVDINGHSLQFINGTDFTIDAATLYAKVNSYGAANSGDVLILADPTTGETQWQTLPPAVDTTGHWIYNVYKRADSFFYAKNGTEVFIGKDSAGVAVDPINGTLYTVLDSTCTVPGSPVTDDAYMVCGSPSGAWAGHAYDIATWNGSAWIFTDGVAGDYAYTTDDFRSYIFRSGTWVQINGVPLIVGGNRLNAPINGGTIDNKAFNLITNNTQRISIANSGAITFKSLTGSGSQLMGLDATGLASRVAIGTGLSLIAGTLSATGFVSNALTNAHIFVGNASNVATDVAMTGDIAITNAGVTSIGANKVLDAMIRQGAGLSVIGRSANSTGNVADITGADHQLLRVAGTTLGFGVIDSSYVTGLHTENYYNTKYLNGNQSITWTGSGDVSGSASGTTSITPTLTLATVNSNVGTFNNVTVNGKGLVTAASNVSYLTSNQNITLSGDVTGSGTTAIATTLATVNSNIGTFGSGTQIPVITVNGKGLITAVSTSGTTGYILDQYASKQTARAWFDTAKLVKLLADTIGNLQNSLYMTGDNVKISFNHTTQLTGTFVTQAATTISAGGVILGNTNRIDFDYTNGLNIIPGARAIGASGNAAGTTTITGGAPSSLPTTNNLNGGTLKLSGGISEGSGTSVIDFYTSSAAASGNTDNTPTKKLTLFGNGTLDYAADYSANYTSRSLIDLGYFNTHGSGGGGGVTNVSVVSANGFAGSVANATTTPAITLSTTITGLLKGNGTAISAATAGSDYVTGSSTNTFTNKSGNISQWTNDAGYLTSISGALLVANNLSDLANAGTARTNLGGTTIGQNVFTLTNPSAITFPRFNADNSVSALDAASFRTAIGAGTGGGDALTTNPLSQFAATTSAQLRGVLSDEDGTGNFLTTNGSAASLTSFPTLNQNTTGSAAKWTTGRTLSLTGDVSYTSPSFDGSANVTAAATIANAAITQAKTANYSAYTLWANNTNASAAPSDLTYENKGKQTYAGTATWDGTPPSTPVNLQYQWTQIGKKVDVWFWLNYTVGGTANTTVDLTLPADLPLPEEPAGRTGTNDVLYTGTGRLATSTTQLPNNIKGAFLIKTGTGAYKFTIVTASVNVKTADLFMSYIAQ